LVLVGCLDEIFFHRRPVLMGVEPNSMVWFLGKKSDDRQASTWFSELQPWTALSYVTSDAGTGLQAAIARLPDRCRLVFTLQREQGMSYVQIAGVLGVSVKTVDAQMGRAVKSLRKWLGPEWP
jgi:DNA-directed RNA polymerase specialized sigma24 family protein